MFWEFHPSSKREFSVVSITTTTDKQMMFRLLLLILILGVNSKTVDEGPVYCTTGGACHCGFGGDGAILTLNKFTGDDKVYGCGGAFRLTGADVTAEWQGSSGLVTAGISFTQDASYDGWEGCCFICGKNLEIAGMIETAWYCEKDAFSTGIWLKGTPSADNTIPAIPITHIVLIASFFIIGGLCCFIGLYIGQRLKYQTMPLMEQKMVYED